MSTKLAITLGITALIAGALIFGLGLTEAAAAGDLSAATTAAVTLPMVGDQQAEYVGAKKCKKCHMQQHKSWSAAKKAHALEVLMPGNASDVKAKFNLDAAKDYSKDETCLACHTTGFGHKGGYFVPDPADAKAVKDAENLAGVGCESCHGPGSAYIGLHEEIMKSKRSYKVDEMYAAGMTKIEEAACVTCHNDKSPTYDAANPFNFEQMKEKGAHDHFPLKQREK